MALTKFLALALGAFIFLAALGPAEDARANGVPQLVKLTYLQGVSNWGPKNAEGVLEFSFAEAYARVDVKNLPPEDGITYEGWLTGGAGQPLLVGTIKPSSAGVGTLDTRLESLNRYDYDLFIVSARSAASPAGAMPAEKSMAGRFTIIKDGAAQQTGDTRPATLPDTGEPTGTTTTERIVRTLAVVSAASGLAIVAIRLKGRRSNS